MRGGENAHQHRVVNRVRQKLGPDVAPQGDGAIECVALRDGKFV